MALVKLDLDRTLGTIDERIFGGFIEHLGRCIYGGVFEPGSPRSDASVEPSIAVMVVLPTPPLRLNIAIL